MLIVHSLTKRFLWLCLAILAHGNLVFAQLPGIAFSHYNSEDGLPNDNISALTLDREGFLWVGTTDGLARFDGRRFEVFRHTDNDSKTIPNNIIYGLGADNKGRIWVSTERGLCWYDAYNRAFRQFPLHKLGAEKDPHLGWLSNLSVGSDGYGWIAASNFLLRIDLNTLDTLYYPYPDNLNGASTFFEDSEQRIWLNIMGRTYRFYRETGQFKYYLGHIDGHPSTGGFGEDSQGKVWSSSWGNGFYHYDAAADRFVDFPDRLAIASCFLFDDLPGYGPSIWVGGGVYGIYILTLRDTVAHEFPNRHLEPYSHNRTRVMAIVRDSATGIVWLGTEGGLEKYDPRDLKCSRNYLPEAESSGQFVAFSQMLQDPLDQYRYWIAVWGSGLFEWHRKENRYKYYGTATGLHDLEPFGMVLSRNGTLWLAQVNGVQEVDTRTGRPLRVLGPGFLKTPRINHKILSIEEGADGSIWIGANYEGLFRLNPTTNRVVKIELPGILDRSKTQRINSLLKDGRHHVYIGSDDGLYRCSENETRAELIWRKPEWQLGFGDMTFDSLGRVWVATRDGALCFNENGVLVDSLNSRNGLPNRLVFYLTTDHQGQLWVGTGNGLFRYDPQKRVVTASFTKKDGLFSNSIENMLVTLPTGEVCVGHMYSFNLFDPEYLPQNTIAPKVILAGLKVLNKPRWPGPEQMLVLNPGENVVSFDFSVLNFTQPEATILSYRLIGFSEEWDTSHPGVPITYTNLDGGDYVLQVKAINGDGMESAWPYELRIKVIPPYYKTGWFRMLISLAIVGLVSLAFWYREQQQRRLDAIRRRIARDLHDDMGSTLSSIRFFSEVAQNRLSDAEHADARSLLRRIADSAGTLSDAVREIVWAIGGKNDQLDDLVTRMREFGLRICEAKNISFKTDLPDPMPQRTLRPDQLRNIYLIFKEAVNNAAKYADCTEIQLRLRIRRQFLTLEIYDNGRGFDPAAVASQGGNGLPNLRQRAAEIGGKLGLETAPGQGVRVVLTTKV